MRLVKRVAILAGLVGAALVTAQAALAHDHDHGWKHKHWRHHPHGQWLAEPPVRYYRAPPVVYERPVMYREMPAYYPPGPPSLNINIPLR